MLIQKGAPVGIIYWNSTPPLPQLANPALKPPLNLLFTKHHFSPGTFLQYWEQICVFSTFLLSCVMNRSSFSSGMFLQCWKQICKSFKATFLLSCVRNSCFFSIKERSVQC